MKKPATAAMTMTATIIMAIMIAFLDFYLLSFTPVTSTCCGAAGALGLSGSTGHPQVGQTVVSGGSSVPQSEQ